LRHCATFVMQERLKIDSVKTSKTSWV